MLSYAVQLVPGPSKVCQIIAFKKEQPFCGTILENSPAVEASLICSKGLCVAIPGFGRLLLQFVWLFLALDRVRWLKVSGAIQVI